MLLFIGLESPEEIQELREKGASESERDLKEEKMRPRLGAEEEHRHNHFLDCIV